MATDIFIKIDGVKGDSVDASHKEEIDVLSWSWASTQAGSGHSGTGAGSGKVSVQDLTFTKRIDSASPVLVGLHFAGTHIHSATLTLRKAGGKPLEYCVITLEDVIISSINHGGAADAAEHSETIGLHFSTFKYVFTPQKADGKGGPSIQTKYNIAGNTAL
jgi:type VI secretion system secreted protein Hcp